MSDSKLSACLIVVGFMAVVGCDAQQRGAAPDSTLPAESVQQTSNDGGPVQDAQEAGDSADADYARRISQMYEEAKRSGQTTATSAAQWISEVTGKAASMGASAADSAGEQLQQLYEQAKKQGETSVGNTKQWAVEDFQKIGDWQYTVESISANDPQAMVNKLNEMGSQRWECFWIDRKQDSTAVLYFKRPMRSYIQRLPYRDLIRLIPLLGGSDESGS